MSIRSIVERDLDFQEISIKSLPMARPSMPVLPDPLREDLREADPDALATIEKLEAEMRTRGGPASEKGRMKNEEAIEIQLNRDLRKKEEKLTVHTALEALTEYFPGEVMAFYIAGMAILNGVMGDTVTIAVTGADGSTRQVLGDPYWAFLFVASLILLLVFMMVLVSKRRADNRKAGKPETLKFPLWQYIAATAAFFAWVAATPGDPFVTTAGATAVAAVCAIFLSLLLPQLDYFFGAAKTTRTTATPPDQRADAGDQTPQLTSDATASKKARSRSKGAVEAAA